jgi:hypothetical protein
MKRILIRQELPEGEYRIFEMHQLWIVTWQGHAISWGTRAPDQIQEVKTVSQPRAFASQVAADRQARLLNQKFATDQFRIEQILTRKA